MNGEGTGSDAGVHPEQFSFRSSLAGSGIARSIWALERIIGLLTVIED